MLRSDNSFLDHIMLPVFGH